MVKNIGRDQKRFNDILEEKVKKSFKGYIVHGEIVVRKGKNIFSLPVKRINTPKFVYGGPKEVGGVGQGEGEVGDAIDAEKIPGSGAGDESSEHPHELEVTKDQLAEFLRTSLKLPRLKDKGKGGLYVTGKKYSSVSKVGPRSLTHFKRSYKEALKRMIGEGTYVPGQPVIIEHHDARYKAPNIVVKPGPRAVVIYMMDVSGSMDLEISNGSGMRKIDVVRNQAFWIDVYLSGEYPTLEEVYIAHDATAWRTDRDDFYKISAAGGTKMSSALDLADKVINDEYPPSDWNIYVFHFSDGDNLSAEDTAYCVEKIRSIHPKINEYGYTEVGEGGFSWYGATVKGSFVDDPKIVAVKSSNKFHVLKTLEELLGKGN